MTPPTKEDARSPAPGPEPTAGPGTAETTASGTGSASDSGRFSERAVRRALLRFRVIAYLVGVGLITLVLVGVPLKYLADAPALAETVSPVHGLLFMIYLALTADLSSRCRLGTGTTLWVMLAGTIPFLSFVMERRVTRTVLERQRSTHGT
ncbi:MULTISPECIES: DUF3817 domain-containing protein [Protofrankia]|uniref:DUF3817 domain-containing protein n=1 Tax=Candidatus Protofrankia datiscae TaxID=2716812 RepID=F8AV92_9ACTN|nr:MULTISPECIES: DUF3817 domain-containing protein [Protofrankia]AEH08184.1 hypothetical protein FsymDg_0659 [Candidatus Protofrankia datiscae]